MFWNVLGRFAFNLIKFTVLFLKKKKKKTKVQMRVYFEILNVYTFQWNKFHFEIQYGAKAMGKISPTLILSKPKLRYLSVISSLDSTQFYNE